MHKLKKTIPFYFGFHSHHRLISSVINIALHVPTPYTSRRTFKWVIEHTTYVSCDALLLFRWQAENQTCFWKWHILITRERPAGVTLWAKQLNWIEWWESAVEWRWAWAWGQETLSLTDKQKGAGGEGQSGWRAHRTVVASFGYHCEKLEEIISHMERLSSYNQQETPHVALSLVVPPLHCSPLYSIASQVEHNNLTLTTYVINLQYSNFSSIIWIFLFVLIISARFYIWVYFSIFLFTCV